MTGNEEQPPDTQRVIPIETAKTRIRRQVARCKVELAEELLREALPLLRDDTVGVAEDVFRRLRRLGLDFGLRVRRDQKPPKDPQDPAEEETLP